MRKVDPVKHEQKRGEILGAAIRCFIRDGFRGASTTDICAEAGISPGHLYHYFPNKEAIIEAMIDLGLAHAAERFEKILAAPDVIEALLADIEQTSLRFRPAQVLNLDGLAEAARNPEFAKIIERHTEAIRRMWGNFLRQAQSQGRVDPGLDPHATADILIAIVDGSRAMPIRNPRLDVRQNVEHLRTMLVRFLGPPDTQSVAIKHRTQKTARPLKLVRKR
ncbi:TetR/AcrR family transcriptional regulator [Bradyrhizobium sp. SSUT18]|uniref:TetR/AcrR family transcriptional regulator n=1 Tax=unclassified Bradyrhizobium TaxID=2631580 RepID=UPI00244D0418|nr:MULTISPECIES: TetR/AcrR family transcriptional regulator [unclassified Bradyrhizobium]MDH2350974.1 TetR/AcrR family transcriptional regulator [Bradyrhizobium sp. SSUT112]MDH2404532.1 TetR/AcrR family transcriptional regulator [Bradyrhizobium sp. SSUT18]